MKNARLLILTAIALFLLSAFHTAAFAQSQTNDDLYTPAVYDRGAYYYTRGMVGRKCDGGGTALINCVKHFFPNLKPKRILDLGCAVGWTTVPLVDEWPDAEVHGIDVGAVRNDGPGLAAF